MFLGKKNKIKERYGEIIQLKLYYLILNILKKEDKIIWFNTKSYTYDLSKIVIVYDHFNSSKKFWLF